MADNLHTPHVTSVSVKSLAAAMPKDVHIIPLDPDFHLVAMTDGNHLQMLVLIDQVALYDAKTSSWHGPDIEIDVDAELENLYDWVAEVFGPSVDCPMNAWLPHGLGGNDAPEHVFTGDAAEVTPLMLGAFRGSAPCRLPKAGIRKLLEIALHGDYERFTELAAALAAPPPLSPPKTREPIRSEVTISVTERGVAAFVRICEKRAEEGSGEEFRGNALAHDLRKRLSGDLELLGPRTEDEVYELAAALYEESPWAREAIIRITDDARKSIRNGQCWLSFKPVILVGPAGSGKSYLARQLAKLIGIPSVTIDAAPATSPAPFVGLDSSWRGSTPSAAVSLIGRQLIANPLVIVDEIDKASPFGSEGIHPSEALLPLLERSTAANFLDPFVKSPLDLSHINWVLTANELDRIPVTLRDRCSVVHVQRPTGADLELHIRRLCHLRDLEEDVADALVESVAEMRSPSLRAIERAVEAAETASSRPMLH